MSKKSLFVILTLGALLSFSAVRASSDRSIIIDNKGVPLSEVDSITFYADDNSAYQMLWKGGLSSSYDISAGKQTIILPYNVNDSVYSLGSDDNWTKVYLTPVGFFYYAAYGNRLPFELDGDVKYANGGRHDFWYYESFDASSSALMLFAKDKRFFTVFEHNDGYVSAYSVDGEDNLDITHGVGDEERSLDIAVAPGDDNVDYTDIYKVLMGVTLQYRDYRPADYDPEFVRLLKLFESILEVPASNRILPTTPAVNDKKYQTTAKLKKRKFHSSKFTIRFETSEVSFPHSAHGATVLFHEDEFKCASSLAIQKVEYWYILDENPDSLTIDKADHKFHITKFSSSPSGYFIRFSDLKPGRKYYYTSCVKIPKDQVGSYVFKFGDRKATVKYGDIYSVETMNEYRLELKSSHTSFEFFSVEIDASGEIGNFTAMSDKENIIWMKDINGWLSKYSNNFHYLDKGKSSWPIPIRTMYFTCPICNWRDKYYEHNSIIYFDMDSHEVNMLHGFIEHTDALFDDDGNYVKTVDHGCYGKYYLANSDISAVFKDISSSWKTPDSYCARNHYCNHVPDTDRYIYEVYSAKGMDWCSDGYSRSPGYSDAILPPLLPEQFQLRIVRVYNESTNQPID